MANPTDAIGSRHVAASSASSDSRTRPRIAFYSHDTMGMGHLRRNLLIASHLASSNCPADTLLIAGTREAGFFAEQAGIDCVTLPALRKNETGEYSARHYDWTLQETTQLRARVIASTLLAYKPDVLVVDKLPQGICNELQRTLQLIRRRLNTRCVLGLRDILDEPSIAKREWDLHQQDAVIERFFDEVWVYGDPKIYDCCAEYSISSALQQRFRFTGYLDQTKRLHARRETAASQLANQTPTALCVVGGGQDGATLAQNFANAELPAGWQGIIVTGPFMPEHQKVCLREAAQGKRLTIVDQLVEADDYLQAADRVVSMGGYNTVTSILSFQKPSLIVPRVSPRQEQWLRAQRLADAKHVSILHPALLTPNAISRWLHHDDAPRPRVENIDLNGLEVIETRVATLTRNQSLRRHLDRLALANTSRPNA